MSESSRTADRARLFWTLLPHLVFAVLFAATFQRWVLPFEDSGREMNTALRLAEGELLYRDIGYMYGPLAPLLDGVLLGRFGRSLGVLVAWRTLLALLGVEALRRLARRLIAEDAPASAICSFAIAACAFGIGGSWPFPYSVAALMGTVGVWWALELALASESLRASLVAGAVAGLAAGTKLEFLPVALAGPLLVLGLRRSRKEAVLAGFLAVGEAGIAFGVPVMAFGTDLMRRQGFLIALDVHESWRRVYEAVLFGGMSARAFVGGGFLEVLVPSALAVALVLFLSAAGPALGRFLTPLLFLAGGLTFFSSGNGWLHSLLPLAGCVAIVALVRTAIESRRGDPSLCVASFGVAIVMLPALLRQPFFLRNPVYGAFSAPLALVVALAWLARRVSARPAFTALVLGLCVAQIGARVEGIGLASMTFVKLPGVSLFLLPSEARFVTEAARVIQETVPEGGTVGIFPEPGFLLFATGRKNPFVDELFLPEIQDAAAEDLMIRRLRERPPDALLVTNRAFPEFGSAVFGGGLLDRFFLEVSRRYVPVRRIGGGATPPTRHVSEGVLFLAAPNGPEARAPSGGK
ncbi:MAG: hypothetical protein NEA02_18655 [Thermoanaerobaculia bacterium]|nr:hypothetical protein [Thermoanaerobaculia bacterium]